MISLSRLFKSLTGGQAIQEQKVISIKLLESDQPQAEEPKFVFTAEQKQAILKNARQEAARIVREAQARAQELTERTQKEKEAWEYEKAKLAKDAESAGFDQGLKEGRLQGQAEYEEKIQFARGVVETAELDYRRQVESSEKTVLLLSMEVAGKILGQKLQASGESFLPLVKAALKEARETREIQLHINPVHYGFMLSQREELIALFPKEVNLYIYPDEKLSESDCLIESAGGRIDAGVDTQLAEMKEKLLELLESELQ